jgi:L-aspartate oxidase
LPESASNQSRSEERGGGGGGEEKEVSSRYFDFVVIGSGIAGLRYALDVSKCGSVAIVSKAEPHETNTNYAQGGVSAVLDPLDSVENHIRDTIVAGAYLCDEETVEVSKRFLCFPCVS